MIFRNATLGLVGATAIASGLWAATAPGLQPLTEKDQARLTETGCNFGFDSGNRTFVFGINRRMMVRTAAGLSVCTLGQPQYDAFSEAKGSVTCGGRRLTLRRLGRTTSHMASDSATFPATLSVTQGTATIALRGTAGTAC